MFALSHHLHLCWSKEFCRSKFYWAWCHQPVQLAVKQKHLFQPGIDVGFYSKLEPTANTGAVCINQKGANYNDQQVYDRVERQRNIQAVNISPLTLLSTTSAASSASFGSACWEGLCDIHMATHIKKAHISTEHITAVFLWSK